MWPFLCLHCVVHVCSCYDPNCSCDARMHCSSCCFFCHISLISLFHVCVHGSERHLIIFHSSDCLQFVNGEFRFIVRQLAHAQSIFIVKYIYSNLTELCVFTKLCKAAVRFWKLHVQRINTANPVMPNVSYVLCRVWCLKMLIQALETWRRVHSRFLDMLE